MIFAPDPELQKAAVAALRAEYMMDVPRGGMHQSMLSHCLTQSYWDATDPLPPGEKEVSLFSIGFAMERVILKREATPEPLVIDGITMSLDTIELFGPADLKTTRMAPGGRVTCETCDRVRGAHYNGEITDHKYKAGGSKQFEPPKGWVTAFKAYARAMGVQSFGIIVMHLVQAEVTAWRMSFSAEELESNWDWMMGRKRILEGMLQNHSPMPFKFNEEQKVGSWDCQYCRYSLRCQLEASVEGLK